MGIPQRRHIKFSKLGEVERKSAAAIHKKRAVEACPPRPCANRNYRLCLSLTKERCDVKHKIIYMVIYLSMGSKSVV